jgi:hypothetical protein
MNRELLLDAARHRVGTEGLPDRDDYTTTAVVIGWADAIAIHAPPGSWVELCEAIDASDRLRDGADIDEWVDVDNLRVNLPTYRDSLQETLDWRVDDAVAAMLSTPARTG